MHYIHRTLPTLFAVSAISYAAVQLYVSYISEENYGAKGLFDS